MKNVFLRYNSLFRGIFLLLLLLTPIFTFTEALAFINGQLITQASALTPVAIKAIKDLLIILMLFIGFAFILQHRKVQNLRLLWVVIFLAVISLLVSLLHSHMMIILAGIRSLLPLLLIVPAFYFIDMQIQKKVAKLLFFLFLLAFIMQIIEFLVAPPWFGSGIGGFSLRNPGFFFLPSVMALFALTVMWYVMHFFTKGVIQKTIIFLLGPLSVLLTNSGSGLLGLFAFYLILLFFKVKEKTIILFISAIGFIVILFILPDISGRENIYISFLTRLSIFFEQVSLDNLLFSPNFGYGTNTAVLLANSLHLQSDSAMIADSTINALLINTGLFSTVIFMLFFLRRIKFTLMHIQFLAIYFPFLLTSIIFEVFPANILLAVNIGYFLSLETKVHLKGNENVK